MRTSTGALPLLRGLVLSAFSRRSPSSRALDFFRQELAKLQHVVRAYLSKSSSNFLINRAFNFSSPFGSGNRTTVLSFPK